jgi:hypothetical protein
MNRPTTIKLPALGIDVSGASLRTRPRSGSIVKVEHVGDRSVEEVLDRSAYVNINADWVNAKGTPTDIAVYTLGPPDVNGHCLQAHGSST